MYKLIIVEDEEIIRKGLVHTIDWLSLDFTVVAEGKDGEEGIYLIEKYKPDLVITDIRMPKINGLEMINEAKKNNKFESIIITSYGEFEYAQKAISIGVKDYILKPIDEGALFKKINEIKINIDKNRIYENIKKHTSNKNEMDLTNFKVYIDSKDVNSYVKYAIKKIKEEYNEKISIEGIADELGVSSSYLSRKFKNETSYTFLDMLNKYRVQKAVEILSKDKYKFRVYEVAEKVGFSDYKHFCCIFKKYTNLSAKDFAKAKSIFIN